MKVWKIKADTFTTEDYLTDFRNKERLFVFKGSDLKIDVTCFNDGALESGLTSVTVSLHTLPNTTHFSSVDNSIGTPTLATYKAGTAEHASVSFTDTQTEALAPGLYTLTITGVDGSGNVVTYASGFIEVKADGS